MNLSDFAYAQTLLGKKVHFDADCKMFPQNGITGRVITLKWHGPELLYILSLHGKHYTIGSSTSGLKCRIID